MKYTVAFVLMVFVLTGCTSYKLLNQAPAEAKTIIITTTEQAADAYKMFGKLLLRENLELAQNDPSFMLITTKPTSKKYGMGGEMLIKISVEVEQKESFSTITIRGWVFDKATYSGLAAGAGVSSSNYNFDKNAQEIENYGMGGSSLKESWQWMQSIAEKYPNGKVSFK